MIGFASERRQIGWIVVGVVVAVSAVIAGGTLSIEYFMSGFGACKTLVRTSIPSPDGSKSIVIFGKECGATVGLNTQASIAPAGVLFLLRNIPLSLLFPAPPSLLRRGLEIAPLQFLLFQEEVRSLEMNRALVASKSNTGNGTCHS
jgi:hypothetical protein